MFYKSNLDKKRQFNDILYITIHNIKHLYPHYPGYTRLLGSPGIFCCTTDDILHMCFTAVISRKCFDHLNDSIWELERFTNKCKLYLASNLFEEDTKDMRRTIRIPSIENVNKGKENIESRVT